jgi:hypothetical protein
MGFVWTEIKKWAGTHNLSPKKIKTGGYEWESKSYEDLDGLVTALWNKVSNNKWVEHQNNYEKNRPENN